MATTVHECPRCKRRTLVYESHRFKVWCMDMACKFELENVILEIQGPQEKPRRIVVHKETEHA